MVEVMQLKRDICILEILKDTPPFDRMKLLAAFKPYVTDINADESNNITTEVIKTIPFPFPSPSPSEPIANLGTKGFYRYNPEDLTTPVEIYKNARIAARNFLQVLGEDAPKVSQSDIKKACKTNIILYGFRWVDFDPTRMEWNKIPATFTPVPPKSHRHGHVAQISIDEMTIIKVFSDQKSAAISACVATSSVTNALKNNNVVSNRYRWKWYDDCSDVLKETYTMPLPEIVRHMSTPKKVQRIDPETDEVLETYSAISTAARAYKISSHIIHTSSKIGEVYKDFKWKILE